MSCSISSTDTSWSLRIVEDQFVEFRAFARIEPGGRLVEAEQHRIGTHGAGNLQPPLRPVGQGAGRIVGAPDQADQIEPIARLVDRGARCASITADAE